MGRGDCRGLSDWSRRLCGACRTADLLLVLTGVLVIGNRMNSNWRADPLVWGHGPTVLEVFLEPTCPFSVKAFGKLDGLLDQVGEDRLTV
jgi:hypothetical protein